MKKLLTKLVKLDGWDFNAESCHIMAIHIFTVFSKGNNISPLPFRLLRPLHSSFTLLLLLSKYLLTCPCRLIAWFYKTNKPIFNQSELYSLPVPSFCEMDHGFSKTPSVNLHKWLFWDQNQPVLFLCDRLWNRNTVYDSFYYLYFYSHLCNTTNSGSKIKLLL